MNLMKKLLSFALLAFATSAFMPHLVSAQSIPVLEMFHGQECPHCHKQIKWLPTLEKMYPGINIKEYEVWHNPENKILLDARLAELGQKFTGVPTNIIGGEVVVGFQPEKILELMEKNFGPPEKIELSEADESSNLLLKSLVLVVLGGGLIFYKKRNA